MQKSKKHDAAIARIRRSALSIKEKKKKNFAMVLLRFSSKEFLFLGARDNPGCSLDLLLLHRKS
jgi:hypothetical protein